MTNRSSILTEYFEALSRLKSGKPLHVSKGVKITNDSVAMEAGRTKGCIKKSRPIFSGLIEAISIAAVEQEKNSPEKQQQENLTKIKNSVKRYRNDLDATMSLLISRIYEIHELKKTVKSLEDQVNSLTAKLFTLQNKK